MSIIFAIFTPQMNNTFEILFIEPIVEVIGRYIVFCNLK